MHPIPKRKKISDVNMVHISCLLERRSETTTQKIYNTILFVQHHPTVVVNSEQQYSIAVVYRKIQIHSFLRSFLPHNTTVNASHINSWSDQHLLSS